MYRYIAALALLPLIAIKAYAQPLTITNEITVDTLDVAGNPQYGPYTGGAPSYWVLEKEVSSIDARALVLSLAAPKGTKAWIEIQSLNAAASGGKAIKDKNKKKKDKKKKNKRSFRHSAKAAKANPSWYVDMTDLEGKFSNILEIKAESQLTKSATGFLLADACNPKGKYLIRVVLDFRTVDVADPASMEVFRAGAPTVVFNLFNPPTSQATLFKFPSEKDPGSAVVLMQTNGASPEYIHFTYNKNGVPVNMNSFLVDQYFFSGNGLFTRLYLGGSYLTGGRVSMHHLSSDKTAIYSVCVSLSRQRQELEGYH